MAQATAPLYQMLQKPWAVPQFEHATVSGHCASLDAKLGVGSHVASCDACFGRQLSNCIVKALESAPTQSPRIRCGQISLVFFDYENPSATTCKESAWAAQLFYNAFIVTLDVSEIEWTTCAADAFATEHEAVPALVCPADGQPA